MQKTPLRAAGITAADVEARRVFGWDATAGHYLRLDADAFERLCAALREP